jgi:uncharacterized protein YdeI (YjbR/CyaY-like superfamily)
MASQNFNAKVDAYIAQAQPFAQPILAHLRELVHEACPNIEESIKWSQPFFEYRSAILCNMSAFKQHCSLRFWGLEISAVLLEAKILQEDGTSPLLRITSAKELPSDKLLAGWMRQAAAFVDSGQYTSPVAARYKEGKPAKPMVKAPSEFANALQKNKKAAAVFAAFSPTSKREYVDWIKDAKRPETRDKRIATAIEWIAEGKQRNWKYQNC